MAAEMAKYHNRIQLKDILDPEPARHAALEHVLDHITQAPQHLMTDLASLLHYEDITFALKNAPPDKAPGPNGIPNELYLSLHNSWQSSVPTHNPPHLDISRLLLHVSRPMGWPVRNSQKAGSALFTRTRAIVATQAPTAPSLS